MNTKIYMSMFNLEQELFQILFVLIVVGTVIWFVNRRVRFWIHQGQLLCSIPGHLTPSVSRLPILVRLIIMYAMSVFFIGTKRTQYREKFDWQGTRYIVVANHQTEKDTLLLTGLLGLRRHRYLIAVNQLKGWRIPVVAWTGGIVVNFLVKGGGKRAFEAAASAVRMEPDIDFVILPQGTLHRDNVIRREDFHDGAVRLARVASEHGSLKVSLLPVGIIYDRDPARATIWQRMLAFMGLAHIRSFFGDTTCGAYVNVGAPISVANLPESNSDATDVIYTEILGLCQQAQQLVDAR